MNKSMHGEEEVVVKKRAILVLVLHSSKPACARVNVRSGGAERARHWKGKLVIGAEACPDRQTDRNLLHTFS